MKLIALAVLLLAAISGAWATEDRDAPARGVGFDQRLGAALPVDAVFTDESGTSVRLSRYFAREPVILVLGYYHCPNLCSTVMTSLLDSLNRVTLDAGRDFQVVAVSIDPSETPVIAASKKAAYLATYARPGAAGGWHFLVGDEDSISRLASSVGFRYRYDPSLKQYAHATGFVVATPMAEIARYFFGVDFPARDLRLALVESSSGRIGSLADYVLLLCCSYDPKTGRYSVVIVKTLQLACFATLLALGGYLGAQWLRGRGRRSGPRDDKS
jgi:protein SCO1/2